MATIQETRNYDRFELLEFNRDIHDTRQLEASMREHGFLDAYPLHVVKNGAGKLKIKGGHHRFVVARKLNIPVKYVICDDNVSIHQLEKTTTRWTLKDYLASWVRIGLPEYLAVRDYHERTGIPLGLCTGLMGGQQGSGNFYDAFKAGTYHASENSIAEPVAEIVMGIAERDVKFAKHPLFVEAIAQCWLTSEFDTETFLTRVAANPSLMKKKTTKDEYLRLIEYVYNYKAQKKVPMAFLAREAARKRSLLKKEENQE